LDFLNEAANQQKLKDLMVEEGVVGVYVPRVYPELCTRRIMVSEWIDGRKLSDCGPDVVRALIPAAQEAFLTQLLQVGFFHSDPHPVRDAALRRLFAHDAPHAVCTSSLCVCDGRAT